MKCVKTSWTVRNCCVSRDDTKSSFPGKLWKIFKLGIYKYQDNTVFPRSLDQFYVTTYYIKCVKISWTYSS